MSAWPTSAVEKKERPRSSGGMQIARYSEAMQEHFCADYGKYSSTDAKAPEAFSPPHASTRPSNRSTRRGQFRDSVVLPIGDHVPDNGSYSSAVGVLPPLTRYWPLDN